MLPPSSLPPPSLPPSSLPPPSLPPPSLLCGVQCMICLLEGILVSTVFYCLRADLWFCWGFLTFLCNWVRRHPRPSQPPQPDAFSCKVPNIGSIVANLAPLPVVALDPEVSIGGSRFAAVVFALTLPLVVHQTVGNYLEPKVPPPTS